jgi:hypothetical protein
MCDACDYRWVPCGDQYCRGYRVELAPRPDVKGCPNCDKAHGGVPDAIVRWWPEAWRALARDLAEHKLEAVVDFVEESAAP